MYKVKLIGPVMTVHFDHVDQIVTGVFSIVLYVNKTRLEFHWDDVVEINVQKLGDQK